MHVLMKAIVKAEYDIAGITEKVVRAVNVLTGSCEGRVHGMAKLCG